MSIFGIRLKNLRDIKGQSQEDVGKALGKSRETISKYEKGEREPGIETIASLANHFGVSADYILGLSDRNYIVSENSPGYYSIYDMEEFEPYLKDWNFVKYLRFAVKMAKNNINIDDLEKFIDTMIISRNRKRP